jgi:hypothetical protein
MLRWLKDQQRKKSFWFKEGHSGPSVTVVNRFLRFASLVGVSLCTFLGTLVAWAAITGSISGVVTDPSGAVVPGVTVVATSVSTNVQSRAVTDAKGFYRFPTLNVDTYNVAANQQGFRDYAQSGIKIDANSDVRIDITMQLGTVTNTVNVKSDALRVETQSTQNGVVIPDTKITSVPLKGRSYIDLLKLQPGVSPYSHSSDSFTSGISATQVSGDLDNGRPSMKRKRELQSISIKECETLLHASDGVLFISVTETGERRPLPFHNMYALVMTPHNWLASCAGSLPQVAWCCAGTSLCVPLCLNCWKVFRKLLRSTC